MKKIKVCVLTGIDLCDKDRDVLQAIENELHSWDDIKEYCRIELNEDKDGKEEFNKRIARWDCCILFLSKDISDDIKKRNDSAVIKLMYALSHKNIIAVRTLRYSVNTFLDKPPLVIQKIPENKTCRMPNTDDTASLYINLRNLHKLINPHINNDNSSKQHFRITFFNTLGEVIVTKDGNAERVVQRNGEENPCYETDLPNGEYTFLFSEAKTNQQIEKIYLSEPYEEDGQTLRAEADRQVYFSEDTAINYTASKYDEANKKYKAACDTLNKIIDIRHNNEHESVSYLDDLTFEDIKKSLEALRESFEEASLLYESAYCGGHRFGIKDAYEYLTKITENKGLINTEIKKIDQEIAEADKKYKPKTDDSEEIEIIVPVFEVTNIVIKNCDRNGKEIHSADNHFYTDDMRYVTPVIHYRANTRDNKILRIKIFNPKGELYKSNSVPQADYTYEDSLPTDNTDSGIYQIAGFSNNDEFWTKEGTYRIEIWNTGNFLYKKTFVLESKQEKPVAKKFCNHCGKYKSVDKFKEDKDICKRCENRKVFVVLGWILGAVILGITTAIIFKFNHNSEDLQARYNRALANTDIKELYTLAAVHDYFDAQRWLVDYYWNTENKDTFNIVYYLFLTRRNAVFNSFEYNDMDSIYNKLYYTMYSYNLEKMQECYKGRDRQYYKDRTERGIPQYIDDLYHSGQFINKIRYYNDTYGNYISMTDKDSEDFNNFFNDVGKKVKLELHYLYGDLDNTPQGYKKSIEESIKRLESLEW